MTHLPSVAVSCTWPRRVASTLVALTYRDGTSASSHPTASYRRAHRLQPRKIVKSASVERRIERAVRQWFTARRSRTMRSKDVFLGTNFDRFDNTSKGTRAFDG